MSGTWAIMLSAGAFDGSADDFSRIGSLLKMWCGLLIGRRSAAVTGAMLCHSRLAIALRSRLAFP